MEPFKLRFKSGVVITTVFLFFVTSNLVNFTICETQQRMVKFTAWLFDQILEIEGHALKFVLSQILRSLVFVAMIFGGAFFLISPKFMAKIMSCLLLCAHMWFNEIYSVTTLRSIESTRFFPTVFSCSDISIFTSSHFHFGFHLLALWCWMAWNAFACFHFWNFLRATTKLLLSCCNDFHDPA